MVTSIEQLQRMIDEIKPYIWENPLAGFPRVVVVDQPPVLVAITVTTSSSPTDHGESERGSA